MSIGQLTLAVYAGSYLPTVTRVTAGGGASANRLGFIMNGITLTQNGSALNFSGTTTFTPTTSGFITYVQLYNSATPAQVISSDSVGLAGSGAIFTFSAMDITAGQPVTVSMNLRA